MCQYADGGRCPSSDFSVAWFLEGDEFFSQPSSSGRKKIRFHDSLPGALCCRGIELRSRRQIRRHWITSRRFTRRRSGSLHPLEEKLALILATTDPGFEQQIEWLLPGPRSFARGRLIVQRAPGFGRINYLTQHFAIDFFSVPGNTKDWDSAHLCAPIALARTRGSDLPFSARGREGRGAFL